MAPQTFDWTVLDREVSQAVAHGKVYSLAIKAGREGTPEWLFDGGVTRLQFHDGGKDELGCGLPMTLGDPTEPAYREAYLGLLGAVAGHLRSRADWFRALTDLKPSGANLDSAENRLPNNCTEGCPVCNTEVWAGNGYTPSGLYAFYDAQLELIAREFPGKVMSYQLISHGFPLVSESGNWLGMDPPPDDLPGDTEQTDTILDRGTAAYPSLFAVQENSLSGGRPPNQKVVQFGAGGFLTGLQTTNDGGDNPVADPDSLDAALKNAFDHSDAVFVEAYEQRLWEAALPSGNPVGAWASELQARAGPLPTTHTATFEQAGRTFAYIHPAYCRTNPAAAGTITVLP